MVQTLENIDKSKVYVDRIEGLDEVVSDVIGDTLTGAVSTITTSDLTAGKVLVSDNNGKVAAGSKGISDLQDALISGTNIKTINGTSLLGSGNITVESGANTSLSNLTVQGKNIANWSTNVTNCITEIPQDIKLELNNGTLTLKAGSKVYVPNGSGTFTTYIANSDKSTTYTSASEPRLVFWNYTSEYMQSCEISGVYSGNSAPTFSGIGYWYDTTNNIIKRSGDSGLTWDNQYSFPIAIISCSGGQISSIDQVFNGFGYIGKINFITNIKLLIAKGYNTDGTYYNQEYVINSPIIARNNFGNNSIMFFRNNNNHYQIYNIGKQYYLGELDYVPNVGSTFQWYYNTTNRMWYMHEQGEQSWRQVDYANLGINTSTETKFKEVFRAVDYNDLTTITTNSNARNIGEIITSSIPLTDAGLHLLDGSLIQGGGIYDDFVQYIAGLVNTYPQCFCSEAEWQQSVNTYGACGKFVYNSTNNTVRLPKITGFIEGTIDSNALGNLVEAGLPNITGEPVNCNMFTNYGGSDTPISSGAIVIKEISSTTLYQGDTTQRAKWYFDASRSNSIYGNSTTVQPQSIKVFYYIVVANSTKTNIEVDIDEIVTDLNSKANDIDVVHKTDEETITGHKIFTNNIDRNVNAIRGQTPSSNLYSDIRFTDNNNNWLAGLEYTLVTDKSSFISLIISDSVGNTTNVKGQIQLGVYSDGNVYTSAPTPHVSSNGANIATTAYVNTKFQVVSTLPASPNGNVYYFIPE